MADGLRILPFISCLKIDPDDISCFLNAFPKIIQRLHGKVTNISNIQEKGGLMKVMKNLGYLILFQNLFHGNMSVKLICIVYPSK